MILSVLNFALPIAIFSSWGEPPFNRLSFDSEPLDLKQCLDQQYRHLFVSDENLSFQDLSQRVADSIEHDLLAVDRVIIPNLLKTFPVEFELNRSAAKWWPLYSSSNPNAYQLSLPQGFLVEFPSSLAGGPVITLVLGWTDQLTLGRVTRRYLDVQEAYYGLSVGEPLASLYGVCQAR